jgi:hypothetical protein
MGLFFAARLVAGFALASPPRRVEEMIHADARRELAAFLAVNGSRESDLAELTCVWRDPSLSSIWNRLWLWTVIVMAVVLSPRRYVVAFCRRRGLQDIYELGRPTIVWESSPRGASAREVLYVFTRTQLLLGLVCYPGHYLGKRLQRPQPEARTA